jgi:hypothetical protein
MKYDQLYNFWCHIFQNKVMYVLLCNENTWKSKCCRQLRCQLMRGKQIKAPWLSWSTCGYGVMWKGEQFAVLCTASDHPFWSTFVIPVSRGPGKNGHTPLSVTSSSTGLLTGGRKRNPSGGPVVQAASKLASGASKKNPGSSPGSYLVGLKRSRAKWRQSRRRWFRLYWIETYIQ